LRSEGEHPQWEGQQDECDCRCDYTGPDDNGKSLHDMTWESDRQAGDHNGGHNDNDGEDFSRDEKLGSEKAAEENSGAVWTLASDRDRDRHEGDERGQWQKGQF
jgi:hypothetical protein